MGKRDLLVSLLHGAVLSGSPAAGGQLGIPAMCPPLHSLMMVR